MMNILLVAATESEIAPLLSKLAYQDDNAGIKTGSHQVKVLITGVGMVATAFSLGQHLATQSYNLAINAGIAGSFDFNLALGDVVSVTEDVFAELGAEDGDEYLTLKDMGLGEIIQHPSGSFEFPALKKVKAITVNQVHGNEFSIAKIIARLSPQIESMEGAAFFYACNQTSTPCVQIRSVSNYAERRNREKWDIGLAVKNLNETIYHLLKNL